MKKLLFFVFMFYFQSQAFNFYNGGLELSFGYPHKISIQNTDDSTAFYEGYGTQAKVLLPFFKRNNGAAESFTKFLFNFTPGVFVGYKSLQLKNTFPGSIEETSDHRGLLAGVYIRNGPLYLSGGYALMKASHKTTGTLSGLSQYSYKPLTYEAGLLFPWGNVLDLGVSYGLTQFELPKEETGLSKNVSYEEHIIWFKMVIYFSKN